MSKNKGKGKDKKNEPNSSSFIGTCKNMPKHFFGHWEEFEVDRAPPRHRKGIHKANAYRQRRRDTGWNEPQFPRPSNHHQRPHYCSIGRNQTFSYNAQPRVNEFLGFTPFASAGNYGHGYGRGNHFFMQENRNFHQEWHGPNQHQHRNYPTNEVPRTSDPWKAYWKQFNIVPEVHLARTMRLVIDQFQHFAELYRDQNDPKLKIFKQENYNVNFLEDAWKLIQLTHYTIPQPIQKRCQLISHATNSLDQLHFQIILKNFYVLEKFNPQKFQEKKLQLLRRVVSISYGAFQTRQIVNRLDKKLRDYLQFNVHNMTCKDTYQIIQQFTAYVSASVQKNKFSEVSVKIIDGCSNGIWKQSMTNFYCDQDNQQKYRCIMVGQEHGHFILKFAKSMKGNN